MSPRPRRRLTLTAAELELGACQQHPELDYFPGPGDTSTGAAAIAVCHTCPIEQRCLEVALSTPEASDHGILGGTSRRERIRIRTARDAARHRARR